MVGRRHYERRKNHECGANSSPSVRSLDGARANRTVLRMCGRARYADSAELVRAVERDAQPVTMPTLSNLADRGTLLLDGATGTEILRRVGVDPIVWSGMAAHTHPEVVQEIHEDYLRAGADVVTANTFSTARHVLDAVGAGDDATALTRRSVELALAARDRTAGGRDVVVAGSMSNVVAWHAGTLSADPKYFPTPEQEVASYREVAEALVEAGAEVIVLEMMLDTERASRAIAAAAESGLPLWIGMSASVVDGRVVAWSQVHEEPADRLADDTVERTELAFGDLAQHLLATRPQAAGVMHTSVENTGPALEELRACWDGPLMAYPEATAWHHVPPEQFAQRCRAWAEEGVQIVGGCCGTTPETTAAIARALGRSTLG